MCHARRSALTATLELLRRTAQEREDPVPKRLAASALAPDSGPVLASFTAPVAIGLVVKELTWAGAEVEACAEAGAEIEACAVAEAEAESVVTAIAAVKLARGLAKATGTAELAEGPEPISTVVVAEATGAVAAITTEAVRPTTESVAAAVAASATPSEAEEQVA